MVIKPEGVFWFFSTFVSVIFSPVTFANVCSWANLLKENLRFNKIAHEDGERGKKKPGNTPLLYKLAHMINDEREQAMPSTTGFINEM